MRRTITVFGATSVKIQLPGFQNTFKNAARNSASEDAFEPTFFSEICKFQTIFGVQNGDSVNISRKRMKINVKKKSILRDVLIEY